MKNYLLLLLCLLGSSTLIFAQSSKVWVQNHQAAPYTKKNFTGLEEPTNPVEVSVPNLENHPLLNPNRIDFREDMETIIGLSTYDLQTNNTMQSRVQTAPNGSISATWTQGNEAPGYPDRGTGYNVNPNGTWDEVPDSRIEESTRTGWPSLSRVANGSDVIVNHGGGLNVLRNPNRAWLESKIPAANDMLWPRSTTGGADGNTIHAIAITTPVANGGVEYLGVDGHVLYYRSLDAGATWDKVDVVLPELDNSFYGAMSADSYYITARGETVAIGIFSSFGDSKAIISRDNGESWTASTFIDSPLDGYKANQGYTVEDIGGVNPNGPGATNPEPSLADSLAIFTTDNSGTVLVDLEDNVHVFWGEMYVSDADTADAGTSFYPTLSGIRYWTEDYPADSTRLVADLVDLNGNDTIDITINANDEVGNYFASLTTFPSAGVDADNQIYLAYSGLAEGFYNEDQAQFYHHIFVTASTDGGENWSDAKDINIPEFSLEPDLVEFVEAVFPSVSDDIPGDIISLTYNLDYTPGLSVRGDEDEAATNFIMYLPLAPEFLGLASATEEVVQPELFDVSIYPNPATDRVLIQLETTEKAAITLELMNNIGQLVQATAAETRGVGTQQFNLAVNALPTGLYTVKIKINDQITTKKLMIK